MPRTTDLAAPSGADFFTHLEPRRLLTLTSPLPELADLEYAYASVARITTNFGDIDIELFGNPNSVRSNFTRYVDDGDYDMSFFHRLEDNFILQGGGFRFTDDDGLSVVPPHEYFSSNYRRPHTERTVAMVEPTGSELGPTQFFFNLADNSDLIEADEDSGPIVFGRVVNDVSWSVVQTIANLPIVDMSGNPAFAGDSAGEFTAVPGGPTPTESNLVMIIDVEIIKPGATDEFYDQHVYYPEGFAGSTINEFLPIGNTHGEEVSYQVIVRAEFPTGGPPEGYTWFRDRVIARGVIGSHRRGGITISQFGEGGAPGINDLVPQGVPYSIEVRSTRSLMVNFSHYDFGTSTGESLVAETARTWTFAHAERNLDTGSTFLVWYNTSAETASIDVTFILNDGSTRTTSVQTDALRRGGLNINELDIIPDGSAFSVVVESDVDINAALTRYSTAGDGTGSTELGIAGEGSTRGVVPMGNAGATAEQFISFVNTHPTDTAVITLIFSFSDGSADRVLTPTALNLAPGRRGDFRVNDIPELNDGRRFTIRYDSGNVPVFAHTRNVQFTDEVGYAVGVSATTSWLYAEGFLDPARPATDVFETISVFNPNFGAMGRADAAASIVVTFYGTAGGSVGHQNHNYSVGPGERLDIDVRDIPGIANVGYFYSMVVRSDVPIVSQLWHHDLTLGGAQPSGGFGELGMPRGDVVRLG